MKFSMCDAGVNMPKNNTFTILKQNKFLKIKKKQTKKFEKVNIKSINLYAFSLLTIH